MSLVVSKATVIDAEVIRKIQAEAWLETYPNESLNISKEAIKNRIEGKNGKKIPQKTEAWKKIISRAGEISQVFVAKENDAVVGFCSVRIREDENHISSLYVAKSYQGKGCGKKLMQRAIDWFDNKNEILVLVASYNERAIAFYRKFGFVPTGREFDDIPGKKHSEVKIPEIEMVLKR